MCLYAMPAAQNGSFCRPRGAVHKLLEFDGQAAPLLLDSVSTPPYAVRSRKRCGAIRSLWYFRTVIVLISSLIPIWLSLGIAARGESPSREQRLARSERHSSHSLDRSSRPSQPGQDANETLFKSALAQMEKAARNPAVVLIPGDLLMHSFRRHISRNGGTPDEAGIATMRWIAGTLKRAFPKAQFAVALGNNDTPCGDYRSDDGGTYMAALARVWAPLVNRYGASPGFEASFVRGGYYTVRLPIRGLRLVVLNTVLMSNEYGGDCAGDDYQAATQELSWLRMTLRATPSGTRNVVMMHVPPGTRCVFNQLRSRIFGVAISKAALQCGAGEYARSSKQSRRICDRRAHAPLRLQARRHRADHRTRIVVTNLWQQSRILYPANLAERVVTRY